MAPLLRSTRSSSCFSRRFLPLLRLVFRLHHWEDFTSSQNQSPHWFEWNQISVIYYTWDLSPLEGARWKVRGSPESLLFVLWTLKVCSKVNVAPLIVDAFQQAFIAVPWVTAPQWRSSFRLTPPESRHQVFNFSCEDICRWFTCFNRSLCLVFISRRHRFSEAKWLNS